MAGERGSCLESRGRHSCRRRALPALALWLVSLSALVLSSPLAHASISAGGFGHYGRHVHQHHHRRGHAAGGGGSSSQAPCTNADTPSTSASAAQMAAAVNCLVNQERARLGLPQLNVSSKLNESAQRWANHLGATGQLYHGNVGNRMSAVGYDWSEGGENIAAQYLTPRDVMAAWMASPEHCQNILDPDYRDVGSGENPDGNNPATWVQDFGLLMGKSSPSSNWGPANRCPYTVPASGDTAASASRSSGSGSSAGGWPTSPSS